MEPGEALSTGAQLALALAGFAGVVVAFRSGSVHEWQAIDKLRLRLLLTNSLLPLTLCAAAMLLLSVRPPPEWIWRACSALAVALVLLVGSIIGKSMRRAPAKFKLPEGSKVLFYTFAFIGIVVMTLQVYNLAVLNAFWAFYSVILLQLLTGALQFVRLILIQPEPTP